MQGYQWDSFKIRGFIVPIVGYKVGTSVEIPCLSHISAYSKTCRAAPLVEDYFYRKRYFFCLLFRCPFL